MQKLTRENALSADLTSDNLAKLKALFPEVVTEGPDGASLNVDTLRQLIGERVITDATEQFGLQWHGKARARQLALTPSRGTLRPCPQESVDWETTQNVFIEGDNLEVLKLLQRGYTNKVKLIYIDPPYNTGRDFVYPDNFRDSLANYQELTAQAKGGRKLQQNTEANGRFHSDWLTMVYPRLKLAKDLLCEGGVILVSIDDVEIANLKACLDELWGSDNLIAIMIHQRAKGGGQAKHVVKGHDYIIAFSKNSDMTPPLRREKVVQGKTEVIDGIEYLVDNDVVRKQFGKYDKSAGDRRCLYEELLEYKGAEAKQDFDRRIAAGELFLAPWENGMHVICRRTPVSEATSKLYSIVRVLSEEGKKDLEKLSLDTAFSYPKPVELISQLVQAATNADEAAIVVDFFAGSGTTGHAVMAQNAADGGNRRYILVQLPEPLDTDNKDQRSAADFCDQLGKPRTIAEITKERLCRAGAKVRKDNPLFAGDLGFRVFKLDQTNLYEWDTNPDSLEKQLQLAAEHMKPDRTEDDLLFELLLKTGLELPLTTPIEYRLIHGVRVASIGAGKMYSCLAPRLEDDQGLSVARAMVAWRQEEDPATCESQTICVFRDAAFSSSVSKINVHECLKQHGITDVRCV